MRKKVSEFIHWWTAGRVAIILLAIGLVTGVGGYISQHPEGFTIGQFLADFYANLSSEMVSIAITVLIIDSLERRRDEEERVQHETDRAEAKREEFKHRLIGQLSSKINRDARRAVELMRDEGWLADGSLEAIQMRDSNLEGADLRHADLRRAQFYRANLKGANLFGANLEGAFLVGTDLEGAQLGTANLKGAYMEGCNLKGARKVAYSRLAEAARLKGAIMPDGGRYNGCFNLKGDLTNIKKNGVNPGDPQGMADWYGVSLEEFLRGQEWAENTLPKLALNEKSAKWQDENATEDGDDSRGNKKDRPASTKKEATSALKKVD